MTKIRKASAIIAAAVTAITATGASVLAANTKDQYWHADNDCATYSYFGKKEDSSSIYVKTNYSPTPGEGSPVYINVYAAKSDVTAYTKENYAYYYNGVMI